MKPTWEHVKRLATIVSLLGTLIALVGWGVSRASSSQVGAVESDVAVLKGQRASDHELLLYGIKRIDAVGDQLNHQAVTGRIPYVEPPPAPPEVAAPVKKDMGR